MIPPLEGRPGSPDQVPYPTKYAAAALKGEIAAIRAAVVGGRNHALNAAALKLGGLIAIGAISEDLVARELYDAASAHFGTGDPSFTAAAAQATIEVAIEAGKRKPRQIGAAA